VKASDNEFPRFLLVVGSADGTPSAGLVTLYAKSDGIYYKDDAGTEFKVTGALSNPMTTAGDIIIGGASGVPARLPADADGKVLKLVSGAPAWADESAGAGAVDWGDIGGTITDQADLVALAATKAPLASPTFTGTPAAPTASAGANSTQIATTAYADAAVKAQLESFILAPSDETTALTTGTNKIKFRMPYAFTVTAVTASLSTAQTSGSIFTVDINEAGTTILSTKLTIDNTESTSTTAATSAVISDSSIAQDAEITVDIDQIGDGTAKGLKVTIIGHQT
jgi:hypothetical protein